MSTLSLFACSVKNGSYYFLFIEVLQNNGIDLQLEGLTRLLSNSYQWVACIQDHVDVLGLSKKNRCHVNLCTTKVWSDVPSELFKVSITKENTGPRVCMKTPKSNRLMERNGMQCIAVPPKSQGLYKSQTKYTIFILCCHGILLRPLIIMSNSNIHLRAQAIIVSMDVSA